jgi:hypothetical protein
MIDDKWMGATTDVVKIDVTREMIALYVKAIHEDSSIYTNVECARRLGYVDIPAPPTLPIIFWKYIDIPWLRETGPVIHGKQRFCYDQPLLANFTYYCSIKLNELRMKKSKQGMMQVANHELVITYNHCIHATAFTTLILFEK